MATRIYMGQYYCKRNRHEGMANGTGVQLVIRHLLTPRSLPRTVDVLHAYSGHNRSTIIASDECFVYITSQRYSVDGDSVIVKQRWAGGRRKNTGRSNNNNKNTFRRCLCFWWVASTIVCLFSLS